MLPISCQAVEDQVRDARGRENSFPKLKASVCSLCLWSKSEDQVRSLCGLRASQIPVCTDRGGPAQRFFHRAQELSSEYSTGSLRMLISSFKKIFCTSSVDLQLFASFLIGINLTLTVGCLSGMSNS